MNRIRSLRNRICKQPMNILKVIILLVIKKIQINTAISYYYTPIKIPKMKIRKISNIDSSLTLILA